MFPINGHGFQTWKGNSLFEVSSCKISHLETRFLQLDKSVPTGLYLGLTSQYDIQLDHIFFVLCSR